MESKSTEPIKVEKWDGNAVKNALDDAVGKIFKEDLGFKEKTLYVDIRLFLSTLGCVVALAALLYDYLYPFPVSKYVLLACSGSYFVLMSILTLFMTFVERNIILQALQKDRAGLDPDSQWTVGTSLRKFDDKYTVQLAVINGVTKKKRQASFTKSVATWFTADGELLFDKFKNDVMSCQRSLVEKKDQ